jgi:hypothetical protein
MSLKIEIKLESLGTPNLIVPKLFLSSLAEVRKLFPSS